jgi:cellulose biosynthesis protein BcsQ
MVDRLICLPSPLFVPNNPIKDRNIKINTIANQKGGGGETITAVTLAHGPAMSGQRTSLSLVDLDLPGRVAVTPGAVKSPGLYRLIMDEEPIEKVAIPTRENLDIIPDGKHTGKAKRTVQAPCE